MILGYLDNDLWTMTADLASGVLFVGSRGCRWTQMRLYYARTTT